jgi:hypothetical protein
MDRIKIYLPFPTSFLVVLFDPCPPSLELASESSVELSAMKSLREPAESDPSSCVLKKWSARIIFALTAIYTLSSSFWALISRAYG